MIRKRKHGAFSAAGFGLKESRTKKKISSRLLLAIEIVLTLSVSVGVAYSNLDVVRAEASQYTSGVAEDYADLENRYVSVFKAMTIQVKEEIGRDPSFSEMNAWLQQREELFRDAVGSKIYDGFAMTYKGGYAHSWNYGDYSHYDPSTRLWYQKAQQAGGEVAVAAPYVTYTGSQNPNSDQYVELSVVQKYSDEVSFDLDLKIYEINTLFSGRSLGYSGSTALLFDKSGYILSTTDRSLYCRNINQTDSVVTSEFSGCMLSLQKAPETFSAVSAGGKFCAAFATSDRNGNTYCVLIPIWSILFRNFFLVAFVTLLLILLEIAISFGNRRTMAEMRARDQMITAISRGAFQRQIYVDIASMTCTPDEQSRNMMPQAMNYREAYERLRKDLADGVSARRFEELFFPG